MHDQRGPVLEPEVPDEVRPEQDAPAGDTENRVRVAAVDRHEFAAEPHVLESTFRNIIVGTRDRSRRNPISSRTASGARGRRDRARARNSVISVIAFEFHCGTWYVRSVRVVPVTWRIFERWPKRSPSFYCRRGRLPVQH